MQTSININRILTSLLLTTSMVLATPSPVNNTTTNGNLTIPILQNRDQIATLTFPGVTPFQACLPFHDNNLCTVAFLDNSAWNGNAKLWAYDHTCEELGSAASVSRDALVASFQGYQFLTRLPDPIGVYVERAWDATDGHFVPAYQGVMLSYHGGPVQALEENFHGLAAWWGTQGADGSSWYFWRAPFPC